MPKLDLDYRPSTFAEILGNQGVVKLLLKRSKDRSLQNQSMMFSGPKGCGKTTLARIVTKAISCTNLQNGEPCDECPSCLSIINETSQSFEEMDAASCGTIDKIRSMIKDADYESFDGSSQVYIVDEAQRLSAAAQEAFLKAIESRLFTVIFCTTDPQKVKTPLRSRLEEYPIYSPPVKELIERLTLVCTKENIEYEESGLTLLARIKENCPRECLIALDTMSQLGKIDEKSIRSYFRFESFEMISEMLSSVDVDPKKAFQILDELSNKESPTWIKDHIVMAIASALRAGVGARATFLVPTNFFAARGRGWTEVASDLARIDKINLSDIESVLLKNSSVVPVIVQTPVIPQIPVPMTQVISVPVIKEEPTKTETIKADHVVKEEVKKPVEKAKIVSKELTIDGVNFSSKEVLTSLDKKIEKILVKPIENQTTVLQVGLSLDHAPISEKDFASSLLSRIRG